MVYRSLGISSISLDFGSSPSCVVTYTDGAAHGVGYSNSLVANPPPTVHAPARGLGLVIPHPGARDAEAVGLPRGAVSNTMQITLLAR